MSPTCCLQWVGLFLWSEFASSLGDVPSVVKILRSFLLLGSRCVSVAD
jgi:hypothetical protein